MDANLKNLMWIAPFAIGMALLISSSDILMAMLGGGIISASIGLGWYTNASWLIENGK